MEGEAMFKKKISLCVWISLEVCNGLGCWVGDVAVIIVWLR